MRAHAYFLFRLWSSHTAVYTVCKLARSQGGLQTLCAFGSVCAGSDPGEDAVSTWVSVQVQTLEKTLCAFESVCSGSDLEKML